MSLRLLCTSPIETCDCQVRDENEMIRKKKKFVYRTCVVLCCVVLCCVVLVLC